MAFIVFEGIDGSGTSTQIQRVAALLRAQDRLVHTTREPSTGPIGKLIREILAGRLAAESATSTDMMALLFAADRIDHNFAEINRGLKAGQIVISDRYDLSSLAYQSAASHDGTNEKATVEWIRSLNRAARRPDLTIVFDVSAAVAEARRTNRGSPAEIYETRELQEKLCIAYTNAESLVPGDRLVHIDANGGVDVVTALVMDVILPALGDPTC